MCGSSVLRLDNASLEELSQLANSAQVKLSRWGARYISTPGSNSSFSIDALAQRVTDFVKEHPHFNEVQREVGRFLAVRIDAIYAESDKQLKESWFFTRWLAVLRDLSLQGIFSWPNFTSSPTRHYWNDERFPCLGFHEIFNHYTREQWVAVFRSNPPEGDGIDKYFRGYVSSIGASEGPYWRDPRLPVFN